MLARTVRRLPAPVNRGLTAYSNTMRETFLDIDFEGFFLARLATDPDPSYEERGLSGFTYAVAGESLLDSSIFFQREDVLEAYGWKEPDYQPVGGDGGEAYRQRFAVKNIREASPDYAHYRDSGIGVRVTGARLAGHPHEALTQSLLGMDARVRITKEGVRMPAEGPHFAGPIFEGRNQIDSDGDPDRFTVNPFVVQVLAYSPKAGSDTAFERHVLFGRYDPLDARPGADPQPPLYRLTEFDAYYDRLPKQRFGNSGALLSKLGIADPTAHFTSRKEWLGGRIAVAEALGRPGLAEAYRSRAYAVGFFSEATGPTVIADRLASRIPLRQLYRHPVRGTAMTVPAPVFDADRVLSANIFDKIAVNTEKPWEILYYLGAYDGDLMAGYAEGTLSVPVTIG